MKMMKRCVALALVTTMTTACTGCGAWWKEFEANPVQQVQTFEQTVMTALSIAEAAWNTIKVFLPAAVLVVAEPRYDQAVTAANKALAALNDAVSAAAAAQTPSPDFSAIMQSVTDAVEQVAAIVNEFKSTPASASASAQLGGKPPPVVDTDSLAKAILTMKHAGHTK